MQRYNRKAVVNRYANNYRAPQYHTTRNDSKLVYVRALPKDVKHGMEIYKRSQAIINKQVKELAKPSCQSWLNNYDHFKELKYVEYEISNPLTQYVNSYLTKIKDYYLNLCKKSNSLLNEKIEKFNNEWTGSHKNHRLPIDQTGKKVKVEEQTALDKEYLKLYSTLKRDHVPTVYCSPKGDPTQWDYLKNSIENISKRDTICFSFDIEAFEKDNKIITEIGISIYDPRENIHSINPILRNYHLIVSESLSLINKNWVLDMKECFLLGESLVLPLKQCVEFIQNLINFYMVYDPKTSGSWKRAFVGHNIEGDFKWLRSIGVVLPETRSVADSSHSTKTESSPTTIVMDTMKIYSAFYGKEGCSLGKILRLFKLPHAFLHNAGNDAYYTLRLLLHLCDVNTRVQCSLDDIEMFQSKAKQLLDRSKEEDKIIPMSYPLTIKSNKQSNNNDNYRKKKDLVPQTEFGGSQWFDDAKDAFESTIESKNNIFKDI